MKAINKEQLQELINKIYEIKNELESEAWAAVSIEDRCKGQALQEEYEDDDDLAADLINEACTMFSNIDDELLDITTLLECARDGVNMHDPVACAEADEF